VQVTGDLVTRDFHHQDILVETQLVANRHQGAAATHRLQLARMGLKISPAAIGIKNHQIPSPCWNLTDLTMGPDLDLCSIRAEVKCLVQNLIQDGPRGINQYARRKHRSSLKPDLIARRAMGVDAADPLEKGGDLLFFNVHAFAQKFDADVILSFA
jgi:hypothetical protein